MGELEPFLQSFYFTEEQPSRQLMFVAVRVVWLVVMATDLRLFVALLQLFR
jgi:hypothetical protein